MKNQIIENILGLAVPIRSLKSDNSIGCGEFLDLMLLADFAKQSALKVVQILPINDTGSDPSPYMALSSIALHPIYLSIKEIDKDKLFEKQIKDLSTKLANEVSYSKILSAKLKLLKEIFVSQKDSYESSDFKKWLKSNDWVIAYAVFKTMKDANNQSSFKEWNDLQSPNSKEIAKFYKENDCFFYVWLQFYLDKQLKEASNYLKSKNIILKGDIPIMMNEDSVDVWLYPNLFSKNLVAGAPPDHYNAEGQRWGFPCYDWAEHEKDNFAWWKARLDYASNYFGAYRIDHVLGFFRIWAINRLDSKATLGFFNPETRLTKEDLYAIGFDDARIKWFSVPHILKSELENSFGDNSKNIISICFDKLNNEEIYNFKASFKNDSDIFNHKKLSDEEKNVLYKMFIDRALLKIDNEYTLAWFFRDSKAYKSLNEDKAIFDKLVISIDLKNNEAWEKVAYKLLSVLVNSTNMIVCAEDLGVVPKCVASVLKSLDILSLKVLRWTKLNTDNNFYFEDISEYNDLVVATLAVHDSSSTRAWWDFEENDKLAMLEMLEIDSSRVDDKFDVGFALTFLKSYITKTRAKWVVLPITDFFALSDVYREEDTNLERINTPGTTGDVNWAYKIKPSLNNLIKDKAFAKLVKSLSDLR